jgi:hypothetical protein
MFVRLKRLSVQMMGFDANILLGGSFSEFDGDVGKSFEANVVQVMNRIETQRQLKREI